MVAKEVIYCHCKERYDMAIHEILRYAQNDKQYVKSSRNTGLHAFGSCHSHQVKSSSQNDLGGFN
jgi:hypothetical protein